MTVKPVLLRSIALTVAGAAIVLTVAGCGGGSKTTQANSSPATANAATTSASAGISKAVYIEKANAICNATNGPLDATALKLASHPSPAEAAHIIAGTFIPEIEGQLSQIKALGTPVGGEGTIATMDRLLAGDIAKIAKNPALAGAAVFHDFAKVAHGYGLTACAPLS